VTTWEVVLLQLLKSCCLPFVLLLLYPVADQKFLKRGTEDDLSVPSSFIENAHNEIYAFTRKSGFLKKI